MIWIILAILIAAADQLSKYIVVKNIRPNEMIPVIDNFFYLTFIRNEGAAFSILQNGRLFFLILTPVIAVFLIYFLMKSKSSFLKLSLAMILGGAAGNYIDRLLIGSVTDFFSFRFGSYPFAIFNVGDAIITIGTCLLAVYLIFIYKEPDKKGPKRKNEGQEYSEQENPGQTNAEQNH